MIKHVLGYVPDEPWVSVYRQGVISNSLGIAQTHSLWPDWMRDKLYELSLSGSWLFRVWVYLAYLLTFSLVSVLLKLRCASFIMVLSGASLLNTLGLFFTTGSPDYRYSLCIVFSCVVAACLILINLLERADHRQTIGLQA